MSKEITIIPVNDWVTEENRKERLNGMILRDRREIKESDDKAWSLFCTVMVIIGLCLAFQFGVRYTKTHPIVQSYNELVREYERVAYKNVYVQKDEYTVEAVLERLIRDEALEYPNKEAEIREIKRINKLYGDYRFQINDALIVPYIVDTREDP